jgi:medium-chain acyl-[acyl-carrier-protein] hydrolase
MEKKYTEHMELRACDCDMAGVWRPSSILETMQETAGVHSAMCDLPRSAMDAMGLAWVLSRVRVDMRRMPRLGEKIRIETYPTPTRHMFFPRSHVFFDEKGEKLGCANSLWVIIDIETRRIVKGEKIAGMLPDNSDWDMAADMPATVRPCEGEAAVSPLTPLFTDMDVNVHVNNAKYLDWCCNALGIEVMREKCITSFDVNYDAEVRPGCELRTELTRAGERFAFCGFEGKKRHFAVGGILAERR